MKESFACIDPALPLCWEDPETLRLGFDRAEARIVAPSAATQRLLGVLQRGLPLSELPRASLRVGATAAERRALIELVAPVLVTRPIERGARNPNRSARNTVPGTASRTALDTVMGTVMGTALGTSRRNTRVLPVPDLAAQFRVAVLGVGGATESLCHAISRAGWVPLDWPTIPSDALTDNRPPRDASPLGKTRHSGDQPGSMTPVQAQPDLCIVVERFMEPPATFHALATSGVPHLTLRFTDRSVRIGPLVVPGRAPCVNCLHLTEVAADPGLPALAAQLQGGFPAAETPASVEVASALALAYVHRWLSGSDWSHATQLRLAVVDGMPSPVPEEHSVLVHPDCACAMASTAPPPLEASALNPRW
ncbi:hypothetical protein ACR5KS_00440 [Leucobacter sp. W1153]|uniref:hypothetical protein n=1 Tax=Leucobacter sp. W1153 TaxID=3439064 RepID=UPI003F2C1A2F